MWLNNEIRVKHTGGGQGSVEGPTLEDPRDDKYLQIKKYIKEA